MIMKKVFNSFFVIIAAMVTFAGCAKQEIDAPATPETKTVQFFANSIETKTVFGTPKGTSYPTLWTEDDRVKVHLNLDVLTGTEATVGVNLEDPIEGKATSARFEAKITSVEAESYTFYAVSPGVAWKDRNQDGVIVEIPSIQTPLQNSVDKKAQVIYSISETSSTIPSGVTMDFNHLSAYGKFVLTDLDDEVTAVNSIKIEVLDETVNLAGRWSFANDHSISPVDHDTNANYLSLTTADVVVVSESNTSDVWFACGPNVDLSNKEVKFTVVTNAGELVKTVKFPEGSILESRKIAKFSVSMKDIAPPAAETIKSYEKVTSDLTDWSGKYLIVYEDGTNAYVFNGLDAVNGYVSAVISDGKIASTTDIDAVAVTIEPMNGGYAIKTANGYIYGVKGSNALKFNATVKQLNTIDYNSKDNSVTITSNTSIFRFNAASNQLRFRYYKSGQEAIILYKYIADDGGETPDPVEPENPTLTPRNLAFSSETAVAIIGEEFTLPTLTGVTAGVTYSSSNTNVATVDASGIITLVDVGATTITATAPATDQYESGTASYTLTVKPAQEDGDEGDSGDIPTTKTWKLVTDASTLKAGDKLAIVSTSKGKIASATISGGYITELSVSISNNSFETLPSDAAELTLGGSSTSWTLTNASGKLLGATKVKKVAWGSGTTTWTILIAKNGDATIQNSTSSYGRFLYNVNDPRFTTYISNTSTSMLLPQIYRYE